MSKLIYKKPYIESILESCAADDLSDLKTIINSTLSKGAVAVLGSTVHKLIKPVTGTSPNTVTHNVFSVQVDFGDGVPQSGIAIYLTSTSAYFLRPDGITTGPITVFTFTVDSGKLTDFVKSNELVDVEELRRTLDDVAEAGSAGEETWVRKVKPHLDYDSSTGIKVKKFSVFADDNSRMIDANAADKITSLYGTVNIGSTETSTDLNINGVTYASGYIHSTTGFDAGGESADVKTNILTSHQGGNISVTANLNLASDKKLKIGNTELSEAQLQELLALLENNG